ncbi:sensor domain-containing protein [Pseudoalteromonas denitrificans]|uniref:Diguanylate cyclase (GGDEF) domain-containing protein n=1 Tax=Pseudoalteromonas denitrificans DSM 6059 TaxID=1123010 RepID=A0A1I1NN63_9GAMM|nr:EAL domain-containing protein [Pseudoalteromonas denitrificans]SFC99124.1 diguanylate cyclase (GGDEF) domain-containing protein [Pseudoalteromonas denitrificans DSM 6059]
MNDYSDTTHLRKYLTGIIGNAPFGIVTFSVNHEVGIINSDAIKLLGFENSNPEDLIDSQYKDAFVNYPSIVSEFQSLIKSGARFDANINNIDFGIYTVNIKIRELFNGALVIIEDITTQAKLEKQLRYQASHDSLTNLGNRQDFEDCVETYIYKAVEHNLPGAVIFIDLDRFKPINDIAGHAAGDEVLKRVAIIFLSHIRERDIVARIGGDEFAILLADCPLQMAEKIAESMRKAIDEMVFIYDDNSFKIGMSAGISCINKENDRLSNIINSADNACQIAKNNGRNQIHVASVNAQEYQQHKQQVAWLPKITKALQQNQFRLFIQEISSLKENQTVKHFEILIRLLNEDGTYTAPGIFIPPAERYDLMPQIDRWVIECAFTQIDKNLCYSINLSGLSTSDSSLASYIESLQKIYQIKAANITFEITETAAIQNIDNCLYLINKLKSKGFQFSLDDFGSGLSSFSYLKNLNIDFLKIDGSFVKEIVNDPASYAMVKSINEVGHAMNLKTIAEFVENKEIYLKLKEIGVDYAQGYFIDKPSILPAENKKIKSCAISKKLK